MFPFLTIGKDVNEPDCILEQERFSNQPSKTVAALDLGGGSTQVTFSAVTPATLKQKSFIHHAQTPKGSTPVYTNSYLGLGLMSARHSIITKGYDDKAREIISECVNPVVKNRKFSYGGNDYFVSGLKSNYPVRTVKDDAFTEGETVPIVDHEKCAKYMIDYVRSKESPPEELQEKEIFAFSYYFDRAVAVGLIDAYKGGKIQVSDFDRVAKQACKEANTDQPFMCLDLTFISVLLEHAFKLEPSSKLHLYKKVNGHEISWALGSAYNMLHKQL